MRGGKHVHCCPGVSGVRTSVRHHRLVWEWSHILCLAGRAVYVEQRDPTMGPHAKLDLVEYVSDVGGPAAYDVSVVTPFRDDATFREQCAGTAGHAANFRHAHELNHQYPHRTPGAVLIPLIVETGGRWHASIPGLVRGLARDYVARTPGLDASAVSAVVARWAARLSAILIRGNGMLFRAAGLSAVEEPFPGDAAAGLACCIRKGILRMSF